MSQPEGEGAKPAEGEGGGGDELSTKLAAAEAERETLKEALAKANRDAARNRRKAAGKNEASDEPDDEPDSSDDKSSAELKRLRRETAELRKETRENKAMDALADSIEDAGGEKLSRATLRRYVRMLDSLKPDELDDAIEDLREELPHIFEKKGTKERRNTPRVRTGGGDADDETGQRRRNSTISETTRKMLQANGLM